MLNWFDTLSKKWSVIHLVFGLSVPGYVLFTVLFHESRLHADQEAPGIESPFFPACKGVKLLERSDFEHYMAGLRLNGRSMPRVQMIPEGAPVLSSKQVRTDSPQSAEFFAKVRNRVHQYHHLSTFHSEMLKGCFELLSKNDSSFFDSLGRPRENFRDYCVLQVRNLVEAVEQSWPKMHVALALSAPRYREGRLLEDESSQFHASPRHPYFGLASLPRLNHEEHQEAVRQYQAEVGRLKAEFELNAPRTQRMSPDFANRYVVSRLESFRRKQKERYLDLLEGIPLLAYLDSANPGPDKYIEALDRIRENSESSLELLRKKGDKDPDLYGKYPSLINDLLEGDSSSCGLAHSWLRGLQKRHNILTGVRISVELALWFTPFATESLLIRSGAHALDTLIYGVHTIHAFRDYRRSYSRNLSAVMNEAGVTDLDGLSKAQRTLVIASLFMAEDVMQISHASPILEHAGVQYLRMKKIIR